jgi:hypothetical protein
VGEEVAKRYGENEMDGRMRADFAEMVGEVLEFQEYLGQIMVDSRQMLEGSIDDLERERRKYGRMVLDFFAKM